MTTHTGGLDSDRGISQGEGGVSRSGKRKGGRSCRRCALTEATCARNGGCCSACTHWKGWTAAGERLRDKDPATPPPSCKQRRGILLNLYGAAAPFAAQCLDCGTLTTPQRTRLGALGALARTHGKQHPLASHRPAFLEASA